MVGNDAKGLGDFGRQVVGLHADPAACDLPIAHNALEHLLGRGHRDSKANAQIAARARINRRVNAQQMPLAVHQRAARVAGVDGRVGLDEILKSVDALVAPQRADDAAGHGLAHAKRVANGQHLVADLRFVRIAQHHHGQFV